MLVWNDMVKFRKNYLFHLFHGMIHGSVWFFFSLFCSLQHQKLNLVSSCMSITMTVGDVDCGAKVLDNEITCRIPNNLTIPSEGLPVKVRLWKVYLNDPSNLWPVSCRPLRSLWYVHGRWQLMDSPTMLALWFWSVITIWLVLCLAYWQLWWLVQCWLLLFWNIWGSRRKVKQNISMWFGDKYNLSCL